MRRTMIDDLPRLKDVITTHGLVAKKALGQNFVLDLNLTSKIARQAGDLSQCDVLEIGPGPGGLTHGLLAEGARKVLAIEKDVKLFDIGELSDIEWHFFSSGRSNSIGADKRILDLLDANNIPYFFHIP